jgi:hypothetical protein
MTLTRRARGAWPVVGALIVLAAAATAAVQQPPERPTSTVLPAATASIAGRILAEGDTPLAGALVEALVSRFENGQRTLRPAAAVKSDHRGEFRLPGLPPGRYYVSARDAALGAVSDESGVARYGPTFFPGVSSVAEARAIVVRHTGESPRVEFRLKRVSPARVSGRILSFDGRPFLSGALILTPIDSDGVQVAQAVPPEDVWIAPDGGFSFGHVAAGRYRIRARGETLARGPALFATFTLSVDGQDVDDVQMMLRPGGTLDGVLTVDGPRTARAPVLSTLRVRAPFADGGVYGDPLGGPVQSDGKFALRGLMTGDHQIVVEGLPSPWAVKSVVLRGRDVADTGIEITEGLQLHGARVTITDRASEVGGRVHDNGAPVADAAVLLFPVAPQFWVRTHRRMRMTRTDAEGRFSLRGLPEGEYLAIASGAIDEGDLGRRELLDAVRALATPVSITGPDRHVTIALPFFAVLPGAPVPTR